MRRYYPGNANSASAAAFAGAQRFASAAARIAYVYSASDLYKVVLQTDTGGLWFVTAVAAGVATFQQINPPASYYGTYANLPAAGNAGRRATLTDSRIQQWIDDGTIWRPLVVGAMGYPPPLAANFAGNFNLSAGLPSLTQNPGSFTITGPTESTANLRGHYFTNGFATAYIECAYQWQLRSGAGFARIAIGLRESATSKAYVLGYDFGYTSAVAGVEVDSWSNATTRTGRVLGLGAIDPNGPMFFRVRRNGANVEAHISRDGVNNYFLIDSVATATIFTTAPDQTILATYSSTSNNTPTGEIISLRQGS